MGKKRYVIIRSWFQIKIRRSPQRLSRLLRWPKTLLYLRWRILWLVIRIRSLEKSTRSTLKPLRWGWYEYCLSCLIRPSLLVPSQLCWLFICWMVNNGLSLHLIISCCLRLNPHYGLIDCCWESLLSIILLGYCTLASWNLVCQRRILTQLKIPSLLEIWQSLKDHDKTQLNCPQEGIYCISLELPS